MLNRTLIHLKNKISCLTNLSPRVLPTFSRILYGNGQIIPGSINNTEKWLTMLQEQKIREHKERIVREERQKIITEQKRLARIRRYETVEKYLYSIIDFLKLTVRIAYFLLSTFLCIGITCAIVNPRP